LVEEDTTKDTEKNHKTERIGFICLWGDSITGVDVVSATIVEFGKIR